jgi:hypothetical protein
MFLNNFEIVFIILIIVFLVCLMLNKTFHLEFVLYYLSRLEKIIAFTVHYFPVPFSFS